MDTVVCGVVMVWMILVAIFGEFSKDVRKDWMFRLLAFLSAAILGFVFISLINRDTKEYKQMLNKQYETSKAIKNNRN